MTKTFEAKDIADATPAEVRDYASTFLGIPTDDVSDADVRAKVEAATEGTTIFVRTKSEDADQAGTPPMDVEGKSEATGGLQGGLGHNDPKVRIVLHAEEKDGVITSRHKEVGVNGVVWLLKRGEPIDIPYRVFLALSNADRDVITHTDEGEVRTQRVKNTPYNIERMPSQEEIDEWEARTAQSLLPA